jgi:heptosyltransferase-3
MPSQLSHIYSRTRAARKVIVVDLGFLGDTVHLVPALWELKDAYPEASLNVLTTPLGAEVLRLAPCVNQTWPVELHREKRNLRQQWRILRELRREHFDVAFNFNGADRTLFMTALTGAAWKIAYPGGRQHFWNEWLIQHWAPRQDPDKLVLEQRRSVLAACGLPLGPVRFGLQIDPAASSWAAEVVPEPAIHLSLNSSKATREWSLEHHLTMLQEVWSKYPTLTAVATSGSNERERKRLNAFAELVKDKRLLTISEPIRIVQLAALLRRCRLHIGPDSGVLHLAVALGLPTISFFREQGAYKSFMPTGSSNHVISVPCHCIDNRDAPCERLGYSECFAGIEPGRVAGLVIDELGRS